MERGLYVRFECRLGSLSQKSSASHRKYHLVYVWRVNHGGWLDHLRDFFLPHDHRDPLYLEARETRRNFLRDSW